MRGTPSALYVSKIYFGIIPAYAGNTSIEWNDTTSGGDHPRVCGEHPYRIIPIPEDMGSSPRMRGTHRYQGWKNSGEGIIPAYAGNTGRKYSVVLGSGDHPRVCGEHIIAAEPAFRCEGSSPRMRGTLSLHLHDG